MLKAKEYRSDLKEVLKRIEGYFEAAEIRGSGVAGFIFAEKGNRGIEIYRSETAVVVEFWVNAKQEIEKEFDTYEKATELVIDWIKTDYEN